MVDYFLKEKADVIRETAIRSVCGLGYTPKVYTQNANECMNRLIKAEDNSNYSKKESSLLPYVERLRSEIRRQQDEQFLAVFGRGQYQLTDEFSFLQVEEGNFYAMTNLQKKSLKKKFLSIKITETEEAPVLPKDAQIIDIPAAMETEGVKRIFQRSENERNLQYTEYFGDGDSKAYAEVENVYDGIHVEKTECVGHVQKRVGTALRKLKKENKGIDGKGKLTDAMIDKLQNYYGIAIRSNSADLEAMRSAIYASLFHCSSSKKKKLASPLP